MLSRVTSTTSFDALAEMSEADARRMEALFEQHDRDRDGVVSFAEFSLLAEEAARAQVRSVAVRTGCGQWATGRGRMPRSATVAMKVARVADCVLTVPRRA